MYGQVHIIKLTNLVKKCIILIEFGCLNIVIFKKLYSIKKYKCKFAYFFVEKESYEKNSIYTTSDVAIWCFFDFALQIQSCFG